MIIYIWGWFNSELHISPTQFPLKISQHWQIAAKFVKVKTSHDGHSNFHENQLIAIKGADLGKKLIQKEN
jgi:hypothetical protein